MTLTTACRAALLVASLAALAACMPNASRTESSKPEFLNSPAAAARDRAFSEAVRAGDFLILSGQLGDDYATGAVVPGGIVPEARQTLSHIKAVLESNGATMADVVKCTAFMADIAEWGAFNNVYKEFFKKPYPARSALGANGLALNARVELECMAYVPKR